MCIVDSIARQHLLPLNGWPRTVFKHDSRDRRRLAARGRHRIRWQRFHREMSGAARSQSSIL
ncbi:hypothetical protein BVI1335_270007 [Burkholderia vietnamiensis]|nr:hypothetical protein BVI1335_270007 [Burkholderia vietnamiensis]